MTDIVVNDLRPRVAYVADGTQTEFAYPFPVLDAADLVIAFNDGETPGGHQITGVGAAAGGAVIFDAPPVDGTRVTLYRELPASRETDFLAGEGLRAEALNAEFDRLTLLAQEARALGQDALRRAPYDSDVDMVLPPLAERASRVLAFDQMGRPIAIDSPALEMPIAESGAQLSAAEAAQSEAAAAASASAAAASADAAAASASEAAASVASIALPGIAAGDAGKYLAVRDDEGGYELRTLILQPVALQGEVRMWGGQIPPPDWRFCDGSALVRADYPSLFAAIGTAFGSGDGTTTFNLPDLRGRTPLGGNHGGLPAGRKTTLSERMPGDAGGSETHLLTLQEIPSHTHGASTAVDGGHSHSQVVIAGPGNVYAPATSGPSGTGEGSSGSTPVGGVHNHAVTVNAAGGGQAHANMPPFRTLEFIIYAGPQGS